MRKKLKRFEDNALRDNVLEPGKELYDRLRGRWHAAYFPHQGPITLELGCGRAAYTLGLAQQFPDQNFVGIDIKGARLWAGSTEALQRRLQNVAFLRTQIEHLDQFFAPEEVSQIYITFPDPRPRDRDVKRRLTSPRFLALYRQLLQPGGGYTSRRIMMRFLPTRWRCCRRRLWQSASPRKTSTSHPGRTVTMASRRPMNKNFWHRGCKSSM